MMEEALTWQLEDEDRWRLDRLRSAVRGLVRLATSAEHLIALGETWDALDQMLAGKPVDVSVDLSIGFERGDDAFREGLHMCLQISDEGVELHQLNRTWEQVIGSDHETIPCCWITAAGETDEFGFEQWMDMLAEVSGSDDATLIVSRDHV